MKMKRLICMMLALVLAMGLVACGAAEEPAVQETEAVVAEPTVAEETEAVDDGLTAYTIHVEDVDGNPIAGAMVQICKDACLPGMTDAEGNAVFNVAEDDYKVSFLMLPAGYTYTTEETEFYFEDGATEITLVLKAE
jgi:hypothetical protein